VNRYWKKSFILSMLLIIMAVSFTSAIADKSSKVLVLPFNIYSKGDYSFLKQSVNNLFSSRLVPECRIIFPKDEASVKKISDNQGNVSERKAIALGKQLDADYVLLGTLIVFGKKISTDTKLINIQTQKTIVTLNQGGNSHGDFLSHISIFAQKINEKVFGRKYFTYTQTPQKKEQINKAHSNPEKIWTESDRYRNNN
jgi:hypothetical protein